MTETLLRDNSAWARLADPGLSDERLTEIADALEAGRIATCLPFLLEAGSSARNARDHGKLLDELLALPTSASTRTSSGVRSMRNASSRGSGITGSRPSLSSSRLSPIATVLECCTTTATTT